MCGTQIFQTMNITKAMAEQVATKMVQPIKDCINKNKSELNDIALRAVKRSLPPGLYELYKQCPGYFNTSRVVNLVNGSQFIRVEMKEYVPSRDYSNNFICTPEEAENVSRITTETDSLLDEKGRVYNSIVSTLLVLRTSKKVKDSFPEAYEYIKEYEEKKTTEVALPVESIMNSINKYKNH